MSLHVKSGWELSITEIEKSPYVAELHRISFHLVLCFLLVMASFPIFSEIPYWIIFAYIVLVHARRSNTLHVNTMWKRTTEGYGGILGVTFLFSCWEIFQNNSSG